MLIAIIVLVVLAIIAGVVMSRKGGSSDTAAPPAAPPAAPSDQFQAPAAPPVSQPAPQVPVQEYVAPVQTTTYAPAPSAYTQPPGTVRDLDDEDAVRPEIDMAALAAARAQVSQEVPDEVLQDVLLDATPQQAAQLFSGVSHEVMAGAIGEQTSGVHFQGQARAEDLAKLSSLSSAVDELDIWNFGDDTSKPA